MESADTKPENTTNSVSKAEAIAMTRRASANSLMGVGGLVSLIGTVLTFTGKILSLHPEYRGSLSPEALEVLTKSDVNVGVVLSGALISLIGTLKHFAAKKLEKKLGGKQSS